MILARLTEVRNFNILSYIRYAAKYKKAGNKLVVDRNDSSGNLVENYIYIIGTGEGGNGGTIEKFNTVTHISSSGSAALTRLRERHKSHLVGDHVYILGGYDAAGYGLQTIEKLNVTPQELANTTVISLKFT